MIVLSFGWFVFFINENQWTITCTELIDVNKERQLYVITCTSERKKYIKKNKE